MTATAATQTAVDAIAARGLTKRFGTTTAVDGVDLTVPVGSVHGLLGPNGAGKTTLLRMMLGLVRPDHGSVQVLGRSPFGAPGSALHGVAGFVESPRFYPYLTATRNLDLLSALDGPASTTSVDSVLDAVGLTARAGQKVGGFSTGMLQRLGIAAALLRDPHLLILDEPTNGLDLNGVRDLHRLIRAVAESGRTVLISSHQMGEIESLCGSVTILRSGRTVFSGPLERLRAAAPAPTFLLSTSNDAAARRLAASLPGPAEQPGTQPRPQTPALAFEPTPDGLLVRADQEAMDEYVRALGRGGIAVRALVRKDTALESLFLRLTDPDALDTLQVDDD